MSAYTVAFGGFLLLGGRATDLLGRRRMYVLGQSLYALASLAGGLAQSELPLILARAVQGLGGALLFPATLALIGNHFAEGPARNRALAIWSIASAFGLALGSALAARSPSCSAGPRSSWSTCRWPAPRRCSPCA
ncbi:major facilitator superfamily (MFS) transporter [Pseudomonas aeruginosa]|nr:major facilitator superfamily (MFS) transporter [Pseudomonas aeruginosa]